MVNYQTIKEDIKIPSQKVPNVSNFRDFLFVVTPRLKYEFHKDYQKAVQELKVLQQTYRTLSKVEQEEKKVFLE